MEHFRYRTAGCRPFCARGDRVASGFWACPQQEIAECLTHMQRAVVFDEALLPEPIHEKADSGACGANHLSQRALIDVDDTGRTPGAVMRIIQAQESTGQPPLAGVQ